jgi:hypothetical protein
MSKIYIILLTAITALAQAPIQNPVVTGSGTNIDTSTGRFIPPSATFASPPGSLAAGQTFIFTDASSAGTCTGGGSSKALCQRNATNTGWDAIGGGGGMSVAGYYLNDGVNDYCMNPLTVCTRSTTGAWTSWNGGSQTATISTVRNAVTVEVPASGSAFSEGIYRTRGSTTTVIAALDLGFGIGTTSGSSAFAIGFGDSGASPKVMRGITFYVYQGGAPYITVRETDYSTTAGYVSSGTGYWWGGGNKVWVKAVTNGTNCTFSYGNGDTWIQLFTGTCNLTPNSIVMIYSTDGGSVGNGYFTLLSYKES